MWCSYTTVFMNETSYRYYSYVEEMKLGVCKGVVHRGGVRGMLCGVDLFRLPTFRECRAD